MAVDIGPKIGIDGEAEFRKSLQNINQQLKTLGSEMNAVTSAFGDNADSEDALTAKSSVLTKQIEAQQKKIDELNKGLTASAEKHGENHTRTLKWQKAANNANAEPSPEVTLFSFSNFEPASSDFLPDLSSSLFVLPS